MALDLRIDNGLLVTAAQTSHASLGVDADRITFIGDPGEVPPARQIIDAAGLAVLAGVIEPHVHMRDPGHTKREDWHNGTRAAAAAGVTCVLEHLNSVPPVSALENFYYKLRIAQAKAVVDFGLYGGVGFLTRPMASACRPARRTSRASTGCTRARVCCR